MDQRAGIWFSEQSSGLRVRRSSFLFLTLPLNHFINSLEPHSFLFPICKVEVIICPAYSQQSRISKQSETVSVQIQSKISSERIFISSLWILASFSAAKIQVLFREFNPKQCIYFLPFKCPWFLRFFHHINCNSEIRLFSFSLQSISFFNFCVQS